MWAEYEGGGLVCQENFTPRFPFRFPLRVLRPAQLENHAPWSAKKCLERVTELIFKALVLCFMVAASCLALSSDVTVPDLSDIPLHRLRIPCPVFAQNRP